MKNIFKFLSLGLLFALSGAVYAQALAPGVNCVPIQTPDWTGCAPNNPGQQAPSRWVDQWGAIATDSTKGVLSVITNLASQEQVTQTVMTDCQAKGGTQCIFQIAYRNECVAMVLGDTGFNIKSGKTIDDAIKSGMKTCNNGGGPNCHVYYSACSLPKRIQ